MHINILILHSISHSSISKYMGGKSQAFLLKKKHFKHT